jgi:hypothetical protein
MDNALDAIVHAWRPMQLSVTKSNRMGLAVPQMRRFEILGINGRARQSMFPHFEMHQAR